MVNSRLVSIPVTNDNAVKESLLLFFKNLVLGKRSIVSDSTIVEKFRNIDINRSNVKDGIQDWLIARDKILEQFYRDLGVRMNQQKKAQVNTEEVESNDQLLLISSDDMLREREEGVERVNALFGTDIRVKLNPLFDVKLVNNDMEGTVIEKKAEKGKLGMQADAASFLLGSTGNQNENNVSRGYAPADVRDVLFHWDVFGNVVDHLCNGKVKILHNIRVRDFAEKPEDNRKLGNFLETVGAYQVFHYTVEISGSMETIRAFCRSLDESYKQRRFYVVRAVTLYSEENGAAILMKQEELAKKENSNSGSSDEEPAQGGRRRRRRNAAQNNAGGDDANNQQSEEELRRQEAERIKRMKVHERPGYGAVLVGIGDMYRAFVDFDYVVLDKNQ